MTTAVRRWWAPEAPGIGPDETDLFLLQAEGDAPQDLGQALLALHRVGAAACEAVATEPLGDEWLLRGVLAKARELVAPPALVTVGKALGDERYGGLLLRDVLDDAEAAAVSLYRTCVSKGLARATAASRVGKVFGVPIRELGRYTVLAQDPKTQPALLDEVADATLMDYVAKVVAEEEPTGEKVTFSKAPAEDYLERHNEGQDAHGRFVRLRTSQETLPGGKTLDELLKEPAVETPARTREAKTRESRTRQSRTREARTREVSATGARAAGERSMQRAGSRRGMDRQFTVRQMALAATHAKLEQAPSLPLGQRPVPDTLARVEEMPFVQPIGHKVAYMLPKEEWNAFKSATGSADRNRAVFRAGALATYAGAPERFADINEEDTGDEHHERKVAHMGEILYDVDQDGGVAGYRVKTFDHRQIYGNITGEELTRAIDRQRELFLDELGVTNKSQELQYVIAADDYDDERLTTLVYLPPSAGRSAYDRPDRRIWEIVVDESQAVGAPADSTHANIELDPNLPLAVSDIARPGDATVERYFQRRGPDGSKGFFRNIVRTQRADDGDIDKARRKRGDVDKAAESHAERSKEFQRLLLAGLVSRDPKTGEFTETAGTRESKVRESKTRSSRTREAKTREARTPDLHREMAREGLTRRTERTPLSRETKRELVAIAAEQENPADTGHGRYTYLDPTYSYAVLDSGYRGSDMDALVTENGLKFQQQAYRVPVDITWTLRDRLNRKERVLNSREATAALLDEQEKAWLAQDLYRGAWIPLHDSSYRIESEQDLTGLANEIEDLVAKRPGAGMLRAVWHQRGDHAEVKLMVNSQPMGEQYLVRYEDHLTDGAIELHSEGETRLFNAKGIERWLRLRYSGVLRGGTFGTGSTDDMRLPRVHTFRAVRKDYGS